MQEMAKSLSLLAELPLPDATKVLPGHEGFSTLGQGARHQSLHEWGMVLMQIILRGPAAGYEAEHTARLFFPDAEDGKSAAGQ